MYTLVRAFRNPKISVIWDTETIEAIGGTGIDKGKEGKLEGLKLLNHKTKVVTVLPVKGLFFAIGVLYIFKHIMCIHMLYSVCRIYV